MHICHIIIHIRLHLAAGRRRRSTLHHTYVTSSCTSVTSSYTYACTWQLAGDVGVPCIRIRHARVRNAVCAVCLHMSHHHTHMSHHHAHMSHHHTHMSHHQDTPCACAKRRRPTYVTSSYTYVTSSNTCHIIIHVCETPYVPYAFASVCV